MTYPDDGILSNGIRYGIVRKPTEQLVNLWLNKHVVLFPEDTLIINYRFTIEIDLTWLTWKWSWFRPSLIGRFELTDDPHLFLEQIEGIPKSMAKRIEV